MRSLGWIYSLADYEQVFALTSEDLKKKILDYPAGISSFNSEMHALGYKKMVSGDPLFMLPPEKMQEQAKKILGENKDFLSANLHTLRSDKKEFLNTIFEAWDSSYQQFVADYSVGKLESRYQAIQLPTLPFRDAEFNLVLCSDLLFNQSVLANQHMEIFLQELCRVSEEVRVFPLLDEKGKVPDSIGSLLLTFQQQGHYGVEIREVPYKLRQGGNAMLRICALECDVT